MVRGDTLWDIADEQLDDPTRWPEIAEDSEQITQTDGRHLTDPDLILPGWTVSLPDQIAEVEPAEASPRSDEAGPAAEVTPPQTPMQAGTDPAADSSASAPSGVDRSTTTLAHAIDAVAVRHSVLPPTPMGGGANQPVSALATPPGGPTVHGDEGRAQRHPRRAWPA